jgi:hypothetical protein
MKLLAVLLFSGAVLASAQDHQAVVNEHGDHVMGFSHEDTTHHFELNYEGGVIDVRVNDVKDTRSRDVRRGQLQCSCADSRHECSGHSYHGAAKGSTPLGYTRHATRGADNDHRRQQRIPGCRSRLPALSDRRPQDGRLPYGPLVCCPRSSKHTFRSAAAHPAAAESFSAIAGLKWKKRRDPRETNRRAIRDRVRAIPRPGETSWL